MILNNMSNSGVVVIDDVFDEVKNLLKILNKNGTALNYFSGTDLDELPSEPLKGVRLLFLDFVLGTVGQQDKTQISTLIGVVKRVLSSDNGPCIIVAWTQHPELLKSFKQEIMKDDNFPKPVVIVDMEKTECVNNAEKIDKKIKENFNDTHILELLLHWEHQGKEALRDVLKMLSDISKPSTTVGKSFDEYSSEWNSGLERHIYKIAETSLGKKNINADRQLLIAAQLALTNPFHDYIEAGIKRNTRELGRLTQNIIKHKHDYSDEEKAHMNTSFLLITKDPDKEIQPGNIYKYSDVFEQMNCEKKDCYYNRIILSNEEIAQEFFSGKLAGYGDKEKLLRGVEPVLVEITPVCDYTQQDLKNAKLVLGILWPKDFGEQLSVNSKTHKPDYGYKSLLIKYNGEIYYLTFNARYIFNVSLHIFESIHPILKARKEFLVDIQHWFSRHISRPGKTEF